jgi:hypothetical protein
MTRTVLLGLLVATGTANAAEIACVEVGHMLRAGVPEDVVIAEIANYDRGDSTPECLAALPQRVRLAFEARPEAAEFVAPLPIAPAQAQPVRPEATALAGPGYDNGPCSDLSLALRARYPATATALSASIGFGAGHFYARKDAPGALFLLTQLAGLGLLTGARIPAQEGDVQTTTTMVTAGAVTVTASRLVDLVTAHASARATTDAMLEKCGR